MVRFGIFFSNYFLGTFWTTFGAILGTHFGSDRPKRVIKSLNVPKTCISKNLKNLVFSIILGSKAFQDSPGRPKKAPKRLPKSCKTLNHGILKCTQKLSSIGPILELFWGSVWDQKVLQNGTKNGTSFGPPLRRHSGVGMLPKRKNKRDVWKR